MPLVYSYRPLTLSSPNKWLRACSVSDGNDLV
jgi:hypothetical protein